MRTPSSTVHFERFMASLTSLEHSERNQLLHIVEWLDRIVIGDPDDAMKAQIRTMLEYLCTILPKIQAIGSPPELFSSTRTAVMAACGKLPEQVRADETTNVLRSLRRLERTSQCYCGRPDGMAPDQKAFRRNGTPPARDILQEYIEQLEQRRETEITEYITIADEWDRLLSLPPGSARIPLLETEVDNRDEEYFHPFGTISMIQVELIANNSNEDADRILFTSSLTSDRRNEVLAEAMHALHAARTTAHEFIKGFTQRTYVARFQFEQNHLLYSGRSLGAGAATAILAELSRETMQHASFLPDGATVITGCILPDGTMEALDERHIRAKVEAVFFSPYSRLVLPKANTGAAEQAYLELSTLYPGRSIDILPVFHLRNVFYHRQAIRLQRRSLLERVTRLWIRHQKNIAVTSVTLLLVTAACYLYFFAIFDNNPHTVRLENNSFLILNAGGQELWREPIEHPSHPVQKEEMQIPENVQAILDRIRIIDLDHDGSNEVVVGHGFAVKGFSDRLYCFNADHSLRWVKPIGTPTKTNENTYLSDVFRVHTLWSGTLDSTNRMWIVASTCDDHYSNFVYLIDDSSHIVGEYFHCGAIYSLATMWNEEHTVKDIILSGFHNGYLSAVVAVLDPRFFSGKSPQTVSHALILPQREPAREKYYIILPRTELCGILSGGESVRVFTKIDNGTIHLALTEGEWPRPDTRLAGFPVKVEFLVDRSMRCIRVGANSWYDKTYRAFREHGLIPSVDLSDYLVQLKQHFRYLDGDEFVNVPTVNRTYHEARQRAIAKGWIDTRPVPRRDLR